MVEDDAQRVQVGLRRQLTSPLLWCGVTRDAPGLADQCRTAEAHKTDLDELNVSCFVNVNGARGEAPQNDGRLLAVEVLEGITKLTRPVQQRVFRDDLLAVADDGAERDALDRVLLASFIPGAMEEVRRIEPGALTCFDMQTGMEMLNALRQGLWDDYGPKDVLLAINKKMKGLVQLATGPWIFRNVTVE